MAAERIHNDKIPRCCCTCWLANGEPCQTITEKKGEPCQPCRAWSDLREFYRELHREERRARDLEARLASSRQPLIV